MRLDREEVEMDSATQIPAMMTRALDSLESNSLIVHPSGRIIYQSSDLESLGIVRDDRIISEDLLALIRVVRRSNGTHRGLLEVARGPIGGGRRTLRVSATPLNDDGIVLALISDESEARRIDAVRRDFVANVSHELKTPIGALSLLSEAILGAKDQPDEVVRFATRMQSEAKRLTELVQEIIDLSRLQSTDPLRHADPVEIAEVVRDAVGQAQFSAESHGIELDVGALEPALVIGDQSQLTVALHNLIENAITYSPERTRVSITATNRDAIVEISVADQGIGIPDNEQDRIFERFYRVDPARSRATGGTGLGLSIVKHVALNHGGDVKVWSKPGVGSTFSLLLPIARAESQGEVR